MSSHSSVSEDSYLLEYDALFGEWIQVFQSVTVPSSPALGSLLGFFFFTLRDEGTTLLQNIGDYATNNTGPHAGRL